MAKRDPLTPVEKELLSAYRAQQRALGVFVRLIHPSDPDGIVTALVQSMEKLLVKFPSLEKLTR